jgi:3-oxoacyl-[acyl-carrier protein] reductase
LDGHRELHHRVPRHRGDGEIKSTASDVDITTQRFGVAGISQYAASEAALAGLASSWAIELASRQITVSVVAPRPSRDLAAGRPGQRRHPAEASPLGRFVQPEEVADLAAFLLGPSGCSTGQRLVICPGASL